MKLGNLFHATRLSESSVTWRGSSPVRVLVVDDFEPFRQFIRRALTNLPNLVICEVSNGLDAFHKAEEIQPELIFLDIGLPMLNGIEAARQIRKLAPKSKIIFVTQESSVDVMQAALNLGAWGYIIKARAATDLQAAVEAALEGMQFIGSGLPHSIFDHY
jgi:DNA-binding NarL/FixJ family response regulator